MTKSIAYEIHTFKDGKWQLDTVHDRKDDAMHEARRLYGASKHISGVKVLQEEFDSEENRASSHVLYNEIRGAKKTKAKITKVEEKKEIIRPKQPPKPKKGSATNYFLFMVLGVSAVLLAVVGIAYYYMGIAK